MRFTRAIVRPPGSNFVAGLTTSNLGAPIYEKALQQHEAYCQGLRQCGLELTELPIDLRYPDSTFVEDTAVLTPHSAILTHPGAASREGEVDAIRPALEKFFTQIHTITAPGTLDGGDICEVGAHFLIGISERTNQEGARQLAAFLAQAGCTSACIDIRGVKGILHLKSGIAALDEHTLVVIDDLAEHPALQGYHLMRVAPQENYAANCVRVNDYVLLAAGYPRLEAVLRDFGYQPLVLDMSEYRKMDGGLSCLSLRF